MKSYAQNVGLAFHPRWIWLSIGDSALCAESRNGVKQKCKPRRIRAQSGLRMSSPRPSTFKTFRSKIVNLDPKEGIRLDGAHWTLYQGQFGHFTNTNIIAFQIDNWSYPIIQRVIKIYSKIQIRYDIHRSPAGIQISDIYNYQILRS